VTLSLDAGVAFMDATVTPQLEVAARNLPEPNTRADGQSPMHSRSEQCTVNLSLGKRQPARFVPSSR
jgi:hypothetical protein